MLAYGDGVADVDIAKLLEFHRAHGKLATITAVQPLGRFGSLEIDDDEVVGPRCLPRCDRSVSPMRSPPAMTTSLKSPNDGPNPPR